MRFIGLKTVADQMKGIIWFFPFMMRVTDYGECNILKSFLMQSAIPFGKNLRNILSDSMCGKGIGQARIFYYADSRSGSCIIEITQAKKAAELIKEDVPRLCGGRGHIKTDGEIFYREEKQIWDMICIFRQESKKREQDGLSPVATVMITPRRMISVFSIYAGGAEARNVM